jgi:1-acyl-sn-glycerol-3-phosphate acyltransferase
MLGYIISFLISFLIINTITIHSILLWLKYININIYWYICDKFYNFSFDLLFYFIKKTGNKYNIYVDEKEFDVEKNYIVVSNHISTSDWFFICNVAKKYKSLEKLKIIMKKEIKYTPIGIAAQNRNMLFLERKKEKDIGIINNYLCKMNKKNWIMIYPEGTYVNPNNKNLLIKSQNYAIKNDLNIFKHVLTPRITGFELMTKSNFDGILDFTIAFEKPYSTILCKKFIPGLFDIFNSNKPINIHIKVRTYNITNNPKKFLYNLWQKKEYDLSKFEINQCFKNSSLIKNNFNIYFYIKFYLFILIWIFLYFYFNNLFYIFLILSLFIMILLISFEKYQSFRQKN